MDKMYSKMKQELNNIRKNIDLETYIQLNYEADVLYQVKYLIESNKATKGLINAYEAWRSK